MFEYQIQDMRITPHLVLVTILFYTCVGCSNIETEKKLASLESRLDSISVQQTQEDSAISGVSKSLLKIDSNLLYMDSLETQLNDEFKKGRKGDKIRMKALVLEIQKTLEQNEIYLTKASENNTDSASSLAVLIKSALQGVSQRVAANNLRLANLNNDLDGLGDDYVILFDEYLEVNQEKWNLEENLAKREKSVKQLEAQLKEMDNYLNTAYMAIGTKRELIDKGIIENGGLLTKTGLNEDFDPMAFTPIDTRSTDEISLGIGKVKVVTEHPSESYTLEQNRGETILIIDVQKDFWSISKYLVVMRS